jgi:hypothetical protein
VSIGIELLVCCSRSGVSDHETRVGTAQTALQIMYEDRDREARLGSLHALHPDRAFPHGSHVMHIHDPDAHRSFRSSPDKFGRPPLARDHLAGSRASHPPPRREIAMTDRQPRGASWGSMDVPASSAPPGYGVADPASLSVPQGRSDTATPLSERRGAAEDASAGGHDRYAGDAVVGPMRGRGSSSGHVPERALSPSAGLSPAWTRGSAETREEEEAGPFLAGLGSWREATCADVHDLDSAVRSGVPGVPASTSERGSRGDPHGWRPAGGLSPRGGDGHAAAPDQDRSQSSGVPSPRGSALSAEGGRRALSASPDFGQPLLVGAAGDEKLLGMLSPAAASPFALPADLHLDGSEADFPFFGDVDVSVMPDEADPLGAGLALSGGRWSGIAAGGPLAWRADLSSRSASAMSPSGLTPPHGFSTSAGSPNTASSMSAASSEGSGVLAGRPTWGGSRERLFLGGVGGTSGGGGSRVIVTPRADLEEEPPK